MTSFAPAHNIKDRRHDSKDHDLRLESRTPRLHASQIETPTRPLQSGPARDRQSNEAFRRIINEPRRGFGANAGGHRVVDRFNP
jgi:hypothetical protein